MIKIVRFWYLFFLFFGMAVLGFSILKVRGLSPEKWISFQREEDIYGELEYLRDNWDWGGRLLIDRWDFWTAKDDREKSDVLFGFSKSRSERADKILDEGHWFLSLHMRRKGSIYALEAMKFLERAYKDGKVDKKRVIELRMEIERQISVASSMKSEKQDFRDIEGSILENLEIVLKQLKAIENS